METTHKAQKGRLTKYDKNPHMWLKNFPKFSRTSHIRKNMSELLRVMDKHTNSRKLREKHGGWVGNKQYQFPS